MKAIVFFILVVFMVGCGGGGGETSDTETSISQTNKPSQKLQNLGDSAADNSEQQKEDIVAQSQIEPFMPPALPIDKLKF